MRKRDPQSGRKVKKFRVVVEHVIATCCAEDARVAALESDFAHRVLSVEAAAP